MENKILFICNAVRWFDRVNGNTYHSVNITRCKDGKQLFCEFEYGYGESYRDTALREMLKAHWLPSKYEAKQGFNNCAYLYERENNYPILWNVSEGLKRECVSNGKI